MTDTYEYPEAHPKAKEIKEVRSKLRFLFTSYNTNIHMAREHYVASNNSLKKMAEYQNTALGNLKELEEQMRVLQELAESPLL